MDLNDEKGQLRTFMRGLRKAIDPQVRKQQEEMLAERLLTLPAFKNAKCVGVYQAVGSELNVTPIINGLCQINPQITIAYPAIIGDGIMHFVRVAPNEAPDFVQDPMILVDPTTHYDWIEPNQFDILLVPALGFDSHLNRLGQGGGYYDRYIPRLKDECLTIGVCFDEQIAEKIPSDVHDCRVDYVISPSHTFAR